MVKIDEQTGAKGRTNLTKAKLGAWRRRRQKNPGKQGAHESSVKAQV